MLRIDQVLTTQATPAHAEDGVGYLVPVSNWRSLCRLGNSLT